MADLVSSDGATLKSDTLMSQRIMW